MKERYSEKELILINNIISYLQNTKVEDWCTDVVRKGNKNCFFGHIFEYGKNGIQIPEWGNYSGDKGGDALWGWFENNVSTTDTIYPVNDGENPKYQQPNPKERCIAFILDIVNGKEKNTYEGMEECARLPLSKKQKNN
jgi:hypothetical protein